MCVYVRRQGYLGNRNSDFNLIKLIYFVFEMRIGHKKDFFISAMRFNFTVKYRFSKKYFFYFLSDRIEIFKREKVEVLEYKIYYYKKKFLFYLSRFIFFNKNLLLKEKLITFETLFNDFTKNHDNTQ